ncbi:basic leucine zipper 61-like [Musa acuminata AAA Group]|uniref:BZIP domain-containing protein n=1 Tax=Musa acuminata subsp. malaccensis TaxID=214687 RepID=A0A804K088_MUSAM|nr:PREDICTED: basic leucine zipper 61-like [Musa acuminata subsp. malaccensis]
MQRSVGATAQLPPKVPNTMSGNWSYFGHHAAPSAALGPHHFLPAAAPPAPGSQPSWVDEFLDFSAARRSQHRRIASDSVAFLEAPLVDEGGGFDRLDDDQLMSMFSDEVPAPPSSSSGVPASSSSPSDHTDVNEDKAGAADQVAAGGPEEAQSVCKTEPEAVTAAMTTKPAAESETFVDPKRVKRILANRQSAQRSRVRKLQYISELERSVTSLQTEVSALSPRVAFLDHQRSILTMGNSHLKQRIAALAQDKIFKDAHQEALKKEIERLRQVYHQLNLDKMAASNAEPAARTEKELRS